MPRRCSAPGACPSTIYGVIHGDPHLGNYQVRPDGTVNLLDFGSIRVFPPRFVGGSSCSIARSRPRRGPRRRGLRDLGLQGPEARDDRGAELWARFLYGPLMEDRRAA